MDLARAVEVFARAFAKGRSRTYPYVPQLIDGLWVLQDTPPRKHSRKIEVMTTGQAPEEVIEKLNGLDLGWHFLCHIDPDESRSMDRRKFYKENGYRALGTEWVFVHDLQDLPPMLETDPPVRLVETPELWETIPQIVGQPRRFRADTRQYAIWHEVRDFGWVHSVPIDEDAWVSDLYVHEDVRQRGYGRALMIRLLHDDKANGVRNSVLVASKLGAKLYPKIGYRQIAVLQLFCPTKR